MKLSKTILNTFMAGVLTIYLYGCGTSGANKELDGPEILDFIEKNKTTGNEHITLKLASEKFSKGKVVTASGLKALKPYLNKVTHEHLIYSITLIESKYLLLSGVVIVDKKSSKIIKSEFIAGKYL